MDRKDIVIATISDLVSDFLYYDRKNDDYLRPGTIEELIKTKRISIDEIVDTFRANLEKGLK